MKVPFGKLKYYEESDVLYYLISEGEEYSAIELAPGVTVELNKEKKIIGIEILDASKFMRNFVAEIKDVQTMNAESITLEEFLANDYESYEYVKGELVPMSMPTMEHGEISSNINFLLSAHLRQRKLGKIYTAETTFQIGESGRKPDVAFVSQERIPENRRQASPIPPDLAIEVVSPSDTVYDVLEKVLEYLDAGTQMVWVIEPIFKTVTVYRSPSNIKILTLNDTLTGEEVVEGFQCAVAEVFE